MGNIDSFIIKIIDDGDGIPANLVNKIFKANTSSKSAERGLRGNGIYLNKYILNSSGADVKVISTSNKGTTIGVELKVNYVEYIQEDENNEYPQNV